MTHSPKISPTPKMDKVQVKPAVKWFSVVASLLRKLMKTSLNPPLNPARPAAMDNCQKLDAKTLPSDAAAVIRDTNEKKMKGSGEHRQEASPAPIRPRALLPPLASASKDAVSASRPLDSALGIKKTIQQQYEIAQKNWETATAMKRLSVVKTVISNVFAINVKNDSHLLPKREFLSRPWSVWMPSLSSCIVISWLVDEDPCGSSCCCRVRRG